MARNSNTRRREVPLSLFIKERSFPTNGDAVVATETSGSVPQYTPTPLAWEHVRTSSSKKGPLTKPPPNRRWQTLQRADSGAVADRKGDNLRPNSGSRGSSRRGTSNPRCRDATLPVWYSTSTTALTSDATVTDSATRRGYAFTEAGLTAEMVDFVAFTRLNAAEIANRETVIAYVQQSIKALWPSPQAGTVDQEAAVEADSPLLIVYGSFKLSLSLPSSDVDMTIQWPHGKEGGDANVTDIDTFNRNLHRLHNLADHLRASHKELAVQVRDQCRMPIIKVIDSTRRISADISISCASNFAVQKVLQRQMRWLQSQPLASVLILITKAALRQWGLSEVYKGGVSSTALYSLVYRFLKERHSGRTTTSAVVDSVEATTADAPIKQPPPASDDGEQSEDSGALTFSTAVSERGCCPCPTYAGSGGASVREVDTSSECCSSALQSPLHGLSAFQQRWPGGKGTDQQAEALGRSLPPSEADALTAECMARYAVSPARLFLSFWRTLAADVFLSGYGVSNVFAPFHHADLEPDDTEVAATLELVEECGWTNSGAADDLTAGSYCLPELLALFQHYTNVLENTLNAGRGRSWTQRPSLLGVCLVDPREVL